MVYKPRPDIICIFIIVQLINLVDIEEIEAIETLYKLSTVTPRALRSSSVLSRTGIPKAGKSISKSIIL